MIYRKLFTILLACLACLGTNASPDGDEGEMVVIREEKDLEHSIPPKSPVQIPIECTFYSSLSSLDICFLTNLGYVTIETENQTTGEYGQTIVNAVAGPMLLPISGTVGHWTITFTLLGGTQYVGELDVY